MANIEWLNKHGILCSECPANEDNSCKRDQEAVCMFVPDWESQLKLWAMYHGKNIEDCCIGDTLEKNDECPRCGCYGWQHHIWGLEGECPI